VYLQVWHKAHTFNIEKGTVIAWLLMICRSRSLDALRRIKNLKQWVNSEEILLDLSDSIEPFDLLITLDSQSKIHTALMCLSESQRQIISLAYFRGYSHQQLANFTGMPLGTVKTELRQAKKRLASFINVAAIKTREVS
jgi:RNA polymerase sigma-70 factor (ECF subfamily)